MTTSKKFGYIRVSHKDMNLDRQLVSMQELGINERDIFQDKASGKDFNRPQYQALKQVLRTGDTLVIKSLDRLGRNYEQIKNEWQELTDMGVFIEIIDMPMLNTNNHNQDLIGKVISDVVLTLLGYVAEQERTFIKSRQREGIENWKKSGKTKSGRAYGRPMTVAPDNFKEVVAQVKLGKITSVQAMAELKMKKTTYYKLLKQM